MIGVKKKSLVGTIDINLGSLLIMIFVRHAIKNFKPLIKLLQSEMSQLMIKSSKGSILVNSSSLRMPPMKTYCTNITSVIDAELNRFGALASSAQHAKMLIFVKHASIIDCRRLTLKKEIRLKTTRFSSQKFKIKMDKMTSQTRAS